MNNEEATGVVIEILEHLPNGFYRVLLDTGFELTVPEHVEAYDYIVNGDVVEQSVSSSDEA